MEVCLEVMVIIPAPEVLRLKQALQHSWTTKGIQKAKENISRAWGHDGQWYQAWDKGEERQTLAMLNAQRRPSHDPQIWICPAALQPWQSQELLSFLWSGQAFSTGN